MVVSPFIVQLLVRRSGQVSLGFIWLDAEIRVWCLDARRSLIDARYSMPDRLCVRRSGVAWHVQGPVDELDAFAAWAAKETMR